MNLADIEAALGQAIAAGQRVRGTTSPNPSVGAVILAADGSVAGVGATQPPNATDNAHAEIVALRAAGERARGGTAIVTLEPCNHTGRTGPCSHALLEAGIREVYYAQPDPFPQASGGAEYLQQHGVTAICLDRFVPGVAHWTTAIAAGRPAVTAKIAQTLDGFSAADDGTSQWITGAAARQHAHVDRSRHDAIIVGTGTVLADDPRLSARDEHGHLFPNQPRPIVVGRREVPPNFHLANATRYDTLDIALQELWNDGVRDVLIEGGPTLVGAALEAGVVDFVHAYLSPAFLASGRASIIRHSTGTSMADIDRWHTLETQSLGNDIFWQLARHEHP